MLKGFVILFTCLTLGEILSLSLQVPIPGNVLGMLLLTGALHFKVIRLKDVKPAADGLLQYIALLFVPPGVGLILYFDILKEEWFSILLANIASTVVVLLVVGGLQQKLEKT